MSQLPSPAPPRRSSISYVVKRGRSLSSDDVEAVKDRREKFNNQVRKVVKTLRSKGSFDSGYWGKSRSIASMRKKAKMLTRKLSLADFKKKNPAASYESWKASAGTAELNDQIKSYELDERKFGEQERGVLLDPNAPDHESKVLERSWLEPFTTSSLGLDIRKKDGDEVGQGQRDSNDQADFRRSCIADYQSEHPDEDVHDY